MDLGLYHDSHQFYYRSIFGAAPSGATVWLRLGANSKLAGDMTVRVRLWRSNEGEHFIPMEWDGSAFTAALDMPDKGCLLWYFFIVTWQDKTFYYGNNSDSLGGVGMTVEKDPRSYQLTVYDKDVTTPDWFKHAIVYQIFPDRFCRGTNSQAVLEGKHDAVIHSRWDDKPFYCKDGTNGPIVYYDFFGGNFAGIKEKLTYLKTFGVTAIYLNPVFESLSNHRYDTGDYHHVDSILGTDEEFSDLCKVAMDLGIRIILDGVFSHTGADSIYFNRFDHYDSVGAFQSKKSPYYDWYRFSDYPTKYESWWGVDDLPNVEETTPSYMDFIIRDDDSVLRRWLKAGISGWRLDVIDELPVPFLRAFYKTLKEENPDAVLIGEVWEDASNKISYSEQREYLCGYDIDSAMNYALRAVALDFVSGHKDARRMNAELTHLIENYPKENWYAMLNLIGSHDIERILTVLTDMGGTNRESAEAIGKKRMEMLMTWQFTMPGAPCIYYGDEAGVTGHKDPDNRRTYPWGHEDQELLEFTRQLGQLRRQHDALQTGRFIPLYADGDVFAYARLIEGGKDVFGKPAEDGFFIIAMNRNASALRTISIYTDGLAYGQLQNCLEPRRTPTRTVNSRFTLTLPPLGFAILKGKETDGHKRAGILLHPTSLPSAYGNGELGKNAYLFVDFLKAAGQPIWQILPLTPPLLGDSPYLSASAFAGNARLISLDVLHDWGWLSAEALAAFQEKAKVAKNWDEVWQLKKQVLWDVSHDKDLLISWEPFHDFCRKNDYWLDDYALFCAVGDFFNGKPWIEWPEDIRFYEPGAIAFYKKELAGAIDHYKFVQYIFFKQWDALHEYAKKNGITILGDMPMFVAHNSADCWAHQHLFDLRDDGNPANVAGVPPDYFCVDGQLWGNPLYDYDAMEKDGFRWWIERFRTLFDYVDEIRIDHFRGFESYWTIPAKAETAREGTWTKGPGLELFQSVYKALGPVPFVAEDLGIITDDVCRLKQALGLPGMKILEFHMHEWPDGVYSFDTEPDSVIYTGTHDNNTLVGWFQDEIDDVGRLKFCRELGLDVDCTPQQLVDGAIAYLYSRRARTAIVPMQDVLALPGSARMNVPGVAEGNWHWQMSEGMLQFNIAKHLSMLCKKFKR